MCIDKGVKVFYGNLACYVFFRLYQKLYQRLLNAKQLAQIAQDDKDDDNKDDDNKDDDNKDDDKEETLDPDRTDADVAAAAAAAAAVADEEALHHQSPDERSQGEGKGGESVYEKFMMMMFDLVEGQLDTSKFEDECRMLLGTNSYELYTLEKVVEKLVLQVQHLTSDSSQQTGAKLLALHEYEHLRAKSETLDDIAPPHLAEYMRNAACLTGEEGCFGFYFDTATQVLSVVLHDLKHSGKADVRAEQKHEHWCDHLVGKAGKALADAPSLKLPYLHRNIVSANAAAAEEKAARGAAEEDADSARALAARMSEGLLLGRHLEMTYSAERERLSYTAHTCDFMHRCVLLFICVTTHSYI